jgi:hypothetical protein
MLLPVRRVFPVLSTTLFVYIREFYSLPSVGVVTRSQSPSQPFGDA